MVSPTAWNFSCGFTICFAFPHKGALHLKNSISPGVCTNTRQSVNVNGSTIVNKDFAFTVHQDGDVKYATSPSSKIRGRDNITTGTWNTRTLRAAWKLQELTHETDRYRWNILGLWRNNNRRRTQGFLDDKHENCVGLLVHKDIVNTVMGCRPVSSRLTTIRLRAIPFNITIVQAHVQMSDYGDNETEEFCDQLQNVIDQTPKKDILVVQRDWNAKVGKGACKKWQGICGPFCNGDTDERGLRLLDFAIFNDLVLANTFGHHKAFRRWTWHSPNRQHHN